LDAVRPEGVVLLGATAVSSVWGRSARLGAHRGQFEEWPEAVVRTHRPDWVGATTHPSAVLRSRNREEDLGALVADLVGIRDQLEPVGRPLMLHAFPMKPDSEVVGVVSVYVAAAADLAVSAAQAQFLADAIGVALIGDLNEGTITAENWAARDRMDQATGMIV